MVSRGFSHRSRQFLRPGGQRRTSESQERRPPLLSYRLQVQRHRLVRRQARHLWVVNVPGGDAKQITDGQDWNDTDPQAGIARSGAYNRTLTPYGFQNEERTYWQAPEVYYKMSPFSFADKLKAPILLIHGEADNNNGTFPIQSERFYSALKGQGATVRFVLLPLESHGYQGRESVLHMFWEMNNWLNTYVKNAPATAASSSAGSTAPSRP